jgi:hypothetical protein
LQPARADQAADNPHHKHAKADCHQGQHSWTAGAGVGRDAAGLGRGGQDQDAVLVPEPA